MQISQTGPSVALLSGVCHREPDTENTIQGRFPDQACWWSLIAVHGHLVSRETRVLLLTYPVLINLITRRRERQM